MALHYIDITGKKFGRLKVVGIAYSKKDVTRGRLFWKCICNCGNKKNIEGHKLRSGHTKSCGCLHKDTVSSHHMSQTRFYRIFKTMIRRCKDDPNYTHVKVSKRWHKFDKFFEDMYEPYVEHVKNFGEKNTTIDRLDNKKGYSKLNCRWATYSQQNNNLRKNITLNYKGSPKTLTEIYNDSNNPKVNLSCFKARIKRGWGIKESLSREKVYN